jgi:hypothetical protein
MLEVIGIIEVARSGHGILREEGGGNGKGHEKH